LEVGDAAVTIENLINFMSREEYRSNGRVRAQDAGANTAPRGNGNGNNGASNGNNNENNGGGGGNTRRSKRTKTNNQDNRPSGNGKGGGTPTAAAFTGVPCAEHITLWLTHASSTPTTRKGIAATSKQPVARRQR
jgi:hypothetical protein